MSSNAVPPSVTPPSPNEWPETIRSLTGITNGSITTVTCPDHGFITEDEGVTSVMFKQVEGMIQINGMNAIVQLVIDTNTFTVNIDSTNFYTYTANGVIVIDSGTPPVQEASFQFFNTPFQNIA